MLDFDAVYEYLSMACSYAETRWDIHRRKQFSCAFFVTEILFSFVSVHHDILHTCHFSNSSNIFLSKIFYSRLPEFKSLVIYISEFILWCKMMYSGTVTMIILCTFSLQFNYIMRKFAQVQVNRIGTLDSSRHKFSLTC